MARKNEAEKDITLFNHIRDAKKYFKKWTVKKSSNDYIQQCLDKASKRATENRGEPDLLYINEDKKLLILVENKDSTNDHISKKGNQPEKFAVDGVKHYLTCFTNEKLKEQKETVRTYLKDWSIVGIAVSGDINDQYNHIISTFIISDNKIKDIESAEILNEEDYLSFFENIDLEKISRNISKSSAEINRMLRSIDSQKRPVLLSALMICLYEKDGVKNDFKYSYGSWTNKNVIRNIPTTVSDILKGEGVDDGKIKVLNNELSFINTEVDFASTNILTEILTELQNNVIPLFNKKTNYDIIGKFYEEFLRYAGVTNVKKGIILTPNHITKLFTELIDIKTNDVFFDSCCGTGAFLIAAMNKLIHEIQSSKLPDKTGRIKTVKEKQLIGFEKNGTMYSLAISNMLFRGDGKSRIYNVDSFSNESKEVLTTLKKGGVRPSIGFINPPYGGMDNKKNPTKKEVQFLETMLDSVSRYGIIIAPMSTYFTDEVDRNRILSKHTLKYVINMPSELFQPNALAHTAIAVFETHQPHNNKKVVFYDLKEDGLVLSKNKGRTDALNKWNGIKKDVLEKIGNPRKYEDSISLVYTNIKDNDEWLIQAHAKIDFSKLSDKHFIETIKKYIIFSTKFKLGILDAPIDELTFVEILNRNKISPAPNKTPQVVLDVDKWSEFSINDLFDIEKGERLTVINRVSGETPLLTASSVNNGIAELIDFDTFSAGKTIFENKITVDMFSNVFYHDYSYFSDDNIHTLLFKNKDYFQYYENKYVNLFLVTILRLFSSKYDYGRQVRLKRYSKEFIKLPSKIVNGEPIPDFAFMESYIRSLPYSNSL
jgi:hypothetical protein